MSRIEHLKRSLSLLAVALAFAACDEGVTGPEGDTGLSVEPSFLIGGSALLADPRPSPWGDSGPAGLVIDLDVSKSVFGENVERFAFRTTAALTMSDGSQIHIGPKTEGAAGVEVRGSEADHVSASLRIRFPSSVSTTLAKEKGAVPTLVAIELLDVRTGAVLDRAEATKDIKY